MRTLLLGWVPAWDGGVTTTDFLKIGINCMFLSSKTHTGGVGSSLSTGVGGAGG